MSAYVHQGRVYFVACGEFVKIGFSSGSLEQRLAAMSGHRKGVIVPEDLDVDAPLVLIRLIPGCVMRDERRLHGLFADLHAAGEWFHFNEAFFERLHSMQYVTYRESLLNFRRARADLKRRPSLAVAA